MQAQGRVCSKFESLSQRRHEADRRKPHLVRDRPVIEAWLHTTIGDIAKTSCHTFCNGDKGVIGTKTAQDGACEVAMRPLALADLPLAEEEEGG